MSDTQTIAIVGAGLMGCGISLAFARAGHQVHAFDPSEETRSSLHSRVRGCFEDIGTASDLTEQALGRITIFERLGPCVESADLVIEAVPERIPLKQKVFAEIEAAATPACLFASNTSVIPITKIMCELKDRSRALGTHWWNPPHMVPLVEVIRTEWTSDAAMDAVFDLLASIGKKPVRVEKDVPGFIGNRLQHALWREAISLVENGVCDAEGVDAVIRNGFGRRLAVLGPLENADLVGTDLTLDIHENVLFDLESHPGPSPHLRKLVEEGRLGMKSGEGFRKWSSADAGATSARVADYLKKIEAILD